jgi:hypothetical protein
MQVLSLANTVLILTRYAFIINFIIILPSAPGFH